MNSHTEYLAALFPRWKASPELLKLIDRDFDRVRLDDEQVRAVIEQHRRERKGNDPDMATIVQRLNNLRAQAAYRPPSAVHAPERDEGPLRTWSEWMAHYRDPFNRRELSEAELDGLEYLEKTRKGREVVKVLKGAA